MTPLANLVGASERVGATASRVAKVRELASFLRTVPADEIEAAVAYLAGETLQGRIGIGYSMLQAAAAQSAAQSATLSIAEVDMSMQWLSCGKLQVVAVLAVMSAGVAWGQDAPDTQSARPAPIERRTPAKDATTDAAQEPETLFHVLGRVLFIGRVRWQPFDGL